MTRSLVEAEKVFCDWLIPEPQIGLNAVQMHQHLQFIADRHLQRLGYTPLYNVENPFPWTERRDYPVKTDFFVKIVTSYQLAVSSRSIAGPAGEANKNAEVDDGEYGAKKDVGNVWAQIGDF
jgi:ribonucleotide reductase beta subunit family protein with ferritin-like domain